MIKNKFKLSALLIIFVFTQSTAVFANKMQSAIKTNPLGLIMNVLMVEYETQVNDNATFSFNTNIKTNKSGNIQVLGLGYTYRNYFSEYALKGSYWGAGISLLNFYNRNESVGNLYGMFFDTVGDIKYSNDLNTNLSVNFELGHNFLIKNGIIINTLLKTGYIFNDVNKAFIGYGILLGF